MMCAATLLENNFLGTVFLFDKNTSIGKKVSITWGGRCNVTTGNTNIKKILQHYPSWSKFLVSAMKKFSPSKVIERFEIHGVDLKIEKDMRVFPKSDKSIDIINVFESLFSQHKNIKLHLGEAILDIQKKNNEFVVTSVFDEYIFDVVVVATWWNTYTQAWSTWNTYKRIQNFWHIIVPLAPSLWSFFVVEKWVSELQWLSFSSACITFEINGVRTKIDGSLLFTHWWISGPLVFMLSAYLAYIFVDAQHLFSVVLQFDSQKDFQYWDKKILEYTKLYPSKQISTLFTHFFSKKFSSVVIKHVFPSLLDINCSSLSKHIRKTICHFLSSTDITLLGRKIGDEFVTAGGVLTDEINSKTMESNLCDGLFCIWELVDVDWFTWWYNLQAARCMGKVAGLKISNMSKKL